MFGFGNEKEEMCYLKYELEIQGRKVWKKRPLTQTCRYQHRHKDHANMKLPKETNKVPITDPKEMEIYDLCDKEFRTIIFKKFHELQEHTERQLNKIRKIRQK